MVGEDAAAAGFTHFGGRVGVLGLETERGGKIALFLTGLEADKAFYDELSGDP